MLILKNGLKNRIFKNSYNVIAVHLLLLQIGCLSNNNIKSKSVSTSRNTVVIDSPQKPSPIKKESAVVPTKSKPTVNFLLNNFDQMEYYKLNNSEGELDLTIDSIAPTNEGRLIMELFANYRNKDHSKGFIKIYKTIPEKTMNKIKDCFKIRSNSERGFCFCIPMYEHVLVLKNKGKVTKVLVISYDSENIREFTNGYQGAIFKHEKQVDFEKLKEIFEAL